MALSAAYADLASRISTDIQSGQSTRSQIGEQGTAFSWTTEMPVTVANFCPALQVAGQSVPVTRVGPSGTPAGIVAEGGQKPSAVGVGSEDVALSKHAAQGIFTIERRVSAPNIVPTVMHTLGSSLMLSFESEAMTTIADDAGGTPVTGGSAWIPSIVSAQGQVISSGGRPGLLIMSATDWSALVAELMTAAGLAIDPSEKSAVGEFLGSLIHISPQAAAGTAYVADPKSIVAFENEDGMLIISDVYSQAATNSVVLTADLFASAFVTSPGLVVPVSLA